MSHPEASRGDAASAADEMTAEPGPVDAPSDDLLLAIERASADRAVVILDLAGVIRLVGELFDTELGLPAHRIAGRRFDEWFRASDGSAIADRIDEVRTLGYAVFDVTRQDTGEPYVCNIIPAPPGYEGRVLVSVRDPEAVRGDAEATAAVGGVQLTFDQTAVATVVSGLDGTILVTNPAMQALIGRDAFSSACVHPDDLDATMQAAIDCFLGKTTSYSMEKRLIHADGHVIWVHDTSTLVRGEDGEPLHFLVQVVDISDRKAIEVELRERDERIRFLTDGLPVAIVEVDVDGTIRSGNAELAELLGIDPIGRSMIEVLHADDLVMMAERSETGRTTDVSEFRIVRPDGETRWIRSHHRYHRSEDGTFAGVTGTWSDVTQDVAAREASRQFGQVLESVPDVVAITDPAGAVLHLNAAGRALLTDDQPVAGLDIVGLLPDLDAIDVQTMLMTACHFGGWRGEARLLGADGELRPVSLSLAAHGDTGGGPDYLSLMARDITEMKAAEAALRAQAEHDALTGLANRTTLYERLERSLRLKGSGARSDQPLAVLFIDLDRFKQVNDEMGHAAGDDVLIQVARRVTTAVRVGDTVARLGGDEFVVVLDPIGRLFDAIAIGERIRRDLSEPFATSGGGASIGASIGITIGDARHSARDLVRAADHAAYEAKAQGRGRVVVAEPGASLANLRR